MIWIDISQVFQHCMSKLTDLEFQSPLFMAKCWMHKILRSTAGVGWSCQIGGTKIFVHDVFRKHSIPCSKPAWQWNIPWNASQNIVHVRHLGLPECREKRPRKNDHLPPQLLLKCLEPPHFHQAFYRLLPFSPGKSQQNSRLEPGLRRDQGSHPPGNGYHRLKKLLL